MQKDQGSSPCSLGLTLGRKSYSGLTFKETYTQSVCVCVSMHACARARSSARTAKAAAFLVPFRFFFLISQISDEL